MESSQLDHWRRTAEQGERSHDRLGMGIHREGNESRPGQAKSEVRDRRNLNWCMSDLANGTVFDVGLRELVGMKVERLHRKRDR